VEDLFDVEEELLALG